MTQHHVVTEFNPPIYAVPASWQILDDLAGAEFWPPVDDLSRERILKHFAQLPRDVAEFWIESLHEAANILRTTRTPPPNEAAG
jgi:hypothetical protein